MAWFRVWTYRGLAVVNLPVHDMLGNFTVAAKLIASRIMLSSLELVYLVSLLSENVRVRIS